MENVYVNRFNQEIKLLSEKVSKFDCTFNLSEYNDVCRSLRELELEYQQVSRDAETLAALGFECTYKFIKDDIFTMEIILQTKHIGLLKDIYEEALASMETRKDAEK